MVPASRAARDIEVTAESLHEDLSRLELQKRALERELAAVAAHLDTVHRALRAFEAVLADPPGATDTVDTGRHRDAGRTEADTPRPPPPSTPRPASPGHHGSLEAGRKQRNGCRARRSPRSERTAG